jgi:hypothetical protein
MVKGYCVSCGRGNPEKGKNIEMKDPEIAQTARGGYMAKGICSKCNKTKMCAMLSKDNAEKAIKEGAKKSF